MVPTSLRERLGPDASEGLLELVERSRVEWRADVIAACTDRFERRLVEEVAGVRVQIAQTEAVLRREMAEMGAAIRTESAQMGATIREEMVQMGAKIREDMAEMGAKIREDMAHMGAGLRQEIAQMGADIRVDMFKWCFLFWAGQLVAVSSIVGVMLRLIR